MKIRLHRGTLGDAMKTAEEIDSTIDAIKGYFERRQVLGYNSASKVTVETYSNFPDDRIGWDKTFLVRIDGAIAAMTDEMVV